MATYQRGTKEAILTDLYNAINAISGIQFVDWQRTYDENITKERCPGVFINDIRTDKTKLLKDVTKNGLMVGIVGWVWADDGEELGTVLNTFIENVKDAIITDRGRSSNAYTTDIDTIQTDGGNIHPQGQFIIMLSITFFSSE